MPQVWGLVPLGHVNFPPAPIKPQVLEVGHTTDSGLIDTLSNISQ